MKYRNPERMAWLVILGAFLAFLVLCATIPLGIRYYLEHATAPQTATLEVIIGTPRYRVPGAVAPIAATRTVQLPEGTTIETDENSGCIISFYDGSTATLFPSTQIILSEMHVPAFSWGVEPITLQLDETRGHLRVGAAALLPLGIAAGPLHGPITVEPVLGMLGLGALGSGIAFALNYQVVRAAGPSTASTVTYLTPLFAIAVGVAFLGETVAWNEPAGGLVVLLGVAVAQGRLRAAVGDATRRLSGRARRDPEIAPD